MTEPDIVTLCTIKHTHTHTSAKPSVKQLRRYSSCPRTYSHAPAVPVSNELLANENLMTDPAAATRTQCAICRVKSNILSGSASIFRGHDDNMLRIKPVPLLLAPLLLLQVNENPISRVYLHGFCIETNRRRRGYSNLFSINVMDEKYPTDIHIGTTATRSNCDRSIVIYAWYTHPTWRARTLFHAILKHVNKMSRMWNGRHDVAIANRHTESYTGTYGARYNNNIRAIVSLRKSFFEFSSSLSSLYQKLFLQRL